MKKLIMTMTILSFVTTLSAFAEETVGEKAKATAHDVKRATKKGAHRVKEVFCAEGDAKCLAKKAKHRAQEAEDYAKDKALETKEAIDSH